MFQSHLQLIMRKQVVHAEFVRSTYRVTRFPFVVLSLLCVQFSLSGYFSLVLISVFGVYVCVCLSLGSHAHLKLPCVDFDLEGLSASEDRAFGLFSSSSSSSRSAEGVGHMWMIQTIVWVLIWSRRKGRRGEVERLISCCNTVCEGQVLPPFRGPFSSETNFFIIAPSISPTMIPVNLKSFTYYVMFMVHNAIEALD